MPKKHNSNSIYSTTIFYTNHKWVDVQLKYTTNISVTIFKSTKFLHITIPSRIEASYHIYQ